MTDEAPADLPRLVAVVGAGTIGRGVAQSVAASGVDVVLVDVSQEQLDNAVAQIRRDLRLQTMFGAPVADVDVVLGRIQTSTDLQSVAAAGIVVENVTESWDVKKPLYEQLDPICGVDTMLAVNTSAVPISRVAALVRAPERVVGMHFMNPVGLMPVVEVVEGELTSEGTVARAKTFLRHLSKEAVVVADRPGFITNRVLMLTINEAIFCVQEGIAGAADVDLMFRGCFGHPMGPLETGDLIGLDTILNSIMVMYTAFEDEKYRPSPLLEEMVRNGTLGRKTGEGFYNYGGIHQHARHT
jgi:3-hydroxybutyryl-CoA dehydrogenase